VTQSSVGWVQIVSADPPIVLFTRLSDQRPNIDQGYGGWTEVARPRRPTLSVWIGSPALRMSLPLLFDRWREGDSIEGQLADLETLAAPSAADGAPPRIRLSAQGGIVPRQEKTWVIDNLTWGDGALTNRDGDRIRQQVTLSLLEYVRDVRVDEDSAALRHRLLAATAASKAGAKKKRVKAKAKTGGGTGGTRAATRAAASPGFGTGEDLATIAARELGDAARWIELAQLNGLRDPRAVTTGQVLRLP